MGAGASKSSGIPTGAELASVWLREIKETIDESGFKEWVEQEEINESLPAEFYGEILAKRFEASRQEGYDYLEKIMENAEPSVGYSFLAAIMEKGRHNIVITTNFDSLTEEAVFIYTSKKPLVIGHSNLAGFINANIQRPQIIKVHHGLDFSPLGTKGETQNINLNLGAKLKSILSSYTPIVIGYAGNDGGFMGLLQNTLDSTRDFFWCVLENEPPKREIRNLVAEKQGRLVPIIGFDELMVLLGDKMQMGLPGSGIEEVAKKRIERYIAQMEEVNKNIEKSSGETPQYQLKDAIDNILSREPETWLSIELKVQRQGSVDAKERLYKSGLEKFPESHELTSNYANFLHTIREDHGNAEKHYKKALELDPNNATINGNYANFLHDARKDYDNAEKYYKKALELDPNNANNNGNYALCLLEQGMLDKAHELINKAFHYSQDLERDLTLELWFYRYACFYNEYPESKKKVSQLLNKGIRSPGWQLDKLVEWVKENINHPEYDQVVAFSKEISER